MNKIKIIRDDITRIKTDAIVNSANKTLLGGGGVDGAIHRAAGPDLLEETRRIGGCPTGEARVTKGYRLPATWVIHTVGPIWTGGDKHENALLANCYRNSLGSAVEIGATTVAFPSISTGAYRFPLERAVRIALRETKSFLEADQSLQKVTFVCFGDEAYRAYQEALDEVLD